MKNYHVYYLNYAGWDCDYYVDAYSKEEAIHETCNVCSVFSIVACVETETEQA